MYSYGKKGELSGYEYMKSGDGWKILSFIKNLFPVLSTPLQNEQRMSLMAVIYQLATFSASGFCYSQCSMYALTRLIV